MTPLVQPFFDTATNSYSYVVADSDSGSAAVIDSVLNFDAASGRASSNGADAILAHLQAQNLQAKWILDTHIHADHLSAARYLQQMTGAPMAIGSQVQQVQAHFSRAFNFETSFANDGSQFDRLLEDGDELELGQLRIRAMHTPGHTPACTTYCCGDAAFVGDTLFMPDYGTARTDFPGGDAQLLYRSIQNILALPAQTRLFMCHDYDTPTRTEKVHETSVAEQRAHNIHIASGTTEADFVEMRRCRDRQLAAPKLLYPSVQFNIRGADYPPPEDNGQRYFKIPVAQVQV
ncbi:MAG: MBL fold metallo-hydrolase [Pseudomonadales bacterium]